MAAEFSITVSTNNDKPEPAPPQPPTPQEDFRSHRHLIKSVVITKSSTEYETDEGSKAVNQYVLREELGCGAYGYVFRCEFLAEPGESFAVKIMSRSVLKRKKEFVKVEGGGRPKVTTAFEDVLTEIAVMKKLRQINIVRLFEVIDDNANDKLYLIMELVKGGQVATWNADSTMYRSHQQLRRTPDTYYMSEAHAKQIMHDILNGLDYLHRQNVVHRDLKPENLLLSADMKTCKICDFGVSRMCEELELTEKHPTAKTARLRNMKGTFHFQAPECLTGEEYDGFIADIWALGVCVFAFFFEKLPWFSDNPASLCELIGSQPLVLPDESRASPQAREFITALLDKNVATRPQNTKAIMAMPWLASTFPSPADAAIHGDAQIFGANVSVNKEDISHALSQTTLDMATIAHIKTMVRTWKKRAMEHKKQREMSSSIASNGSSSGNAEQITLSNMGVRSSDSLMPSMEDLGVPSPPSSPAPPVLVAHEISPSMREMTMNDDGNRSICCSLS